jgi:tetratricopeptide (TPR) repeat protein
VLKKIDVELKNLQFPLIQEGLKSLNEAYDLKSAGKFYENAAKRAKDHLVAAQSIGDSYLACDLTGQVYLLNGDYANSLKDLEKSIGLYQLNPPAEPDFMMGYVYYRIAQVNLVYQHDDKKALDVITIGQKFLESENMRFDKIRNTLSEKKRDQIMKQYDAASLDLQNMKLDIYMNAIIIMRHLRFLKRR